VRAFETKHTNFKKFVPVSLGGNPSNFPPAKKRKYVPQGMGSNNLGGESGNEASSR